MTSPDVLLFKWWYLLKMFEISWNQRRYRFGKFSCRDFLFLTFQQVLYWLGKSAPCVVAMKVIIPMGKKTMQNVKYLSLCFKILLLTSVTVFKLLNKICMFVQLRSDRHYLAIIFVLKVSLNYMGEAINASFMSCHNYPHQIVAFFLVWGW